MRGIAKLAFRVDKIFNNHDLEPLYRPHMFRDATVTPQADSRFMALPAELRLTIYEFVFSSTYDKVAKMLSILLTCRKVHGEAIILALRTMQFHLDGSKGLTFGPKLRSLGDLQQHLRHIHVSIPIQQLNANSSNNPFVLTKLPLTILEVDFGKIKVADSWLRENYVYHRFVSALLYQTAPATLDATTAPLHKSAVEKNKRRVKSILLKQWATRKQLHYMVVNMKANKLVVKCEEDTKDILWSAFTHFGLVSEGRTELRVGGARHRIMFYDCDQQNVLEIGVGALGPRN
jgi:hypothetical protein